MKWDNYVLIALENEEEAKFVFPDEEVELLEKDNQIRFMLNKFCYDNNLDQEELIEVNECDTNGNIESELFLARVGKDNYEKIRVLQQQQYGVDWGDGLELNETRHDIDEQYSISTFEGEDRIYINDILNDYSLELDGEQIAKIITIIN